MHLKLKRIVIPGLFFYCIGINIYFRLFPAYFPQLRKEAQKRVLETLRRDSWQIVKRLYPYLSPYAKEIVTNRTIRGIIEKEENKKNLSQQIQQVYKELKDPFQNEHSQTYLLELDPYHWMRYVRNILRYGHPGNEKREGRSYDTYMLAPVGCKVVSERFPFYLASFLYKGYNFFFRKVDLHRFLFYLPLFYIFIFLTVLYLFCRHFFSHIAGFFAVLFVGLNRIFLQRSCAGWFDYDALILLLPLVIVWLLVCALRNKESCSKLVIYSALASIFLAIFAYTWTGWWFILPVSGTALVFGLVNSYSLHSQDNRRRIRKETGSYLIVMGIYFAGGILFYALITHTNLIKTFLNLLSYYSRYLGTATTPSIWPNVFYTIGELQKPTFERIIYLLYGRKVCLFTVGGMLWLYLKKRREKFDLFAMLFCWLMFMLFACLRGGVRFVIFLIIPLGIFLGGTIDEITQRLRRGARRKVTLPLFLGFTLWLLTLFIRSGYRAACEAYPLMNDDWAKALTYIKENTPKECILNSWWDYGNFFEEVAERRVLFNGHSQDTPVAYWMAKVLTSSDEEKAVRILRMLNNASYKTFDFLNQYIQDPFKCYMVLEKLLEIEKREDARRFLRTKLLPSEAIEKVLNEIFSKPAPAYFIVEPTILSKMAHISFLSNWDMRKLYVKRNFARDKNTLLRELSETFDLTPEQSEAIYQTVALTIYSKHSDEVLSERWYFYPPVSGGRKEGDLVYFDGNALVYNPHTHQTAFFSSFQRYKTPQSLFLFHKGKLREIEFENSTSNVCALIIEEKGGYRSLLLDKELADSLFVRLLLFKGKGLKFFEPFYMDDKARIYVYRIKWEEMDE
ncbi:MAG: hypothetical protein DRP75_02065 [Candidatus Omnitrophota bacterium]|nr:MAG: hypothetical protein DRP75_02065 [Candidatus Omnitrophota bacterium]